MNCYEDLVWRGLIKDTIGNVKNLLNGEPIKFYVGVDCTGDGSGMHIGHLMAAIVSRHLQRYGHTPILIKGIATALSGDPSGRDTERPEISYEQVMVNSTKIESQLKHLLGEDTKILNNNDWMSKMTYVDFMREMGRVITLNQMLSKTVIKNRIEREQGISMIEACYMLIQGMDALHLYRNEGVTLEIGGSDQWTNIELGVEAVRKKENAEFFGLTWDLIIDPTTGKKFGKTANGKNIWLDGSLTSPYEMYQFFINVDDNLGEELIKKFTFLSREEIETLIAEHKLDPSKRILQKCLAKEVVTMVHSEEDYKIAVATSEILFGNPTKETLEQIEPSMFEKVFDGVPTFHVSSDICGSDCKFLDAAVDCGAFESKGNLRKLIQSNGVSINRSKVTDVNRILTKEDFIHGQYLTIQKGKKVNMLVVAV